MGPPDKKSLLLISGLRLEERKVVIYLDNFIWSEKVIFIYNIKYYMDDWFNRPRFLIIYKIGNLIILQICIFSISKVPVILLFYMRIRLVNSAIRIPVLNFSKLILLAL